MGVMEKGKGVNTPGTNAEESGQVKIGESSQHRGLAARGNYLSQDRPDIQFASKEISRFMSQPDELDWRRVKRLARYLVNSPRLVLRFPYQKLPDRVTVWSDTDFAGCTKTRRSTSGGL